MLYSQNNSAPFHTNLSSMGMCQQMSSCFPGGYSYPHTAELNFPTTSFSSYINSSGITTMVNAVVMNTTSQSPALYPPTWNAALPCGVMSSNNYPTHNENFPLLSVIDVNRNTFANESPFIDKENDETLVKYKPVENSVKTNAIKVEKENRPKLPLQTVNSNCVPHSIESNTTKYDEKYWERRQKNNEAAKHSRSKRRDRENQLRQRVAELETENKLLRKEIHDLKKTKQ